jgi:hypothetical protein
MIIYHIWYGSIELWGEADSFDSLMMTLIDALNRHDYTVSDRVESISNLDDLKQHFKVISFELKGVSGEAA